jgi:hypothetical protein
MKEYTDSNSEEESAVLAIQSGEWVIKEATNLLNKYHSCKTAYAQNKLLPRIDYMLKRLAFEKKELGKMMGYDEV